uniref:Uncharacterized protein n=1 Tax=Panagrolaimus davidi TaxID=227884 RepID=A0A914QTJ5_9BILA
MEYLDALSSDGENFEQYGDDIKFVGNEREGIELELKYKELKFRFCSDGCMDKVVVACYDSTNPNSNAKGECGPGQCEFKAGISEGDDKKPFLWFYDKFHNKFFPKNGDVCQSATMEFPETKTTGIPPFPSCEPLKHDGNVFALFNR